MMSQLHIDILWFLTRFPSGGVSKNLKLWNIQNTDSDDTTVMLHDELEFDAAIVSCVMDEQMNLGNKTSNQMAFPCECHRFVVPNLTFGSKMRQVLYFMECAHKATVIKVDFSAVCACFESSQETAKINAFCHAWNQREAWPVNKVRLVLSFDQ